MPAPQRARRPRYELFLDRTLLREAELQFFELPLELGRLVGIEVTRNRLGPFLEGAFPFLFGQGFFTHPQVKATKMFMDGRIVGH